MLVLPHQPRHHLFCGFLCEQKAPQMTCLQAPLDDGRVIGNNATIMIAGMWSSIINSGSEDEPFQSAI